MFGMWATEPGRRGTRGPRAKRGDVRAAALALLAEGPMNGYQIIQEISERSDGMWRPSPGSVYPALQQLEDEGLVRAEAERAAAERTSSPTRAAPTPRRTPTSSGRPGTWSPAPSATRRAEMRSLIGQVAMAACQVVSAGTESQATQARQILTDTRRALYRLLAADDEETAAGTGD